MGMGVTLATCKTACLTTNTCNFVVFRGSNGACTEFASCSSFQFEGTNKFEAWGKQAGHRRARRMREMGVHCSEVACTQDQCPDGQPRRPVGDDCCSCEVQSSSQEHKFQHSVYADYDGIVLL